MAALLADAVEACLSLTSSFVDSIGNTALQRFNSAEHTSVFKESVDVYYNNTELLTAVNHKAT
jgi:hypothetical protein